jgi:hypothetical protein
MVANGKLPDSYESLIAEFEEEEPPAEDDLEEHAADLFAVLQEDDNCSE